MSRMANPFDELATVEPTFQVDGPWCGHFQLDGRSVRCAIDRAGWLQLLMPLPGSGKDLVREHERLQLPIKIVPGPALVGEMPCDGDLTSAFELLRASLHRGVDLLESERGVIHAADHAGPEMLPRLESILDQSAFTWSDASGLVSTRTGNGKVVVTLQTESVIFRAPMAHLGQASPASLEALEHFILMMNARLRLVRGSFVAGRLVGEVVWPIAVLTPTLVDHAARSIDASLRTKKACLALANGLVAEQYLELHTHRKDLYADTHH